MFDCCWKADAPCDEGTRVARGGRVKRGGRGIEKVRKKREGGVLVVEIERKLSPTQWHHHDTLTNLG